MCSCLCAIDLSCVLLICVEKTLPLSRDGIEAIALLEGALHLVNVLNTLGDDTVLGSDAVYVIPIVCTAHKVN